MQSQEKFHEPETEVSIDSVLCNESDIKDRSITWSLSNYGKWRLFLNCLVTIGIQLIFLKIVFREPRASGLLSFFAAVLTTGILLWPTLPILTYGVTEWIRSALRRTGINCTLYHQSSLRDHAHNPSTTKPQSPIVNRGREFLKHLIRNPACLLVLCIHLILLGYLVQDFGFKHDPRYENLQLDFPQMNATAILHLSSGNHADQYLDPDLDNIHVEQQGSEPICPDNVCSRFALPYIQVYSTCVNVTSSLRRTCAAVPEKDGPRCTWSTPGSQAELNEISSHLLSSAFNYKDSTENVPGDIISLTAIKWLDRTAEDLIPIATECKFDLRGVWYNTSLSLASLANTAKEDRSKALQTIYKPEFSANKTVIGEWPLEIEHSHVSSLQQIFIDKLTGEVVADYLEEEDLNGEIKTLIEIADGGNEGFVKASNFLAQILSEDIKDGNYRRIEKGTSPWNFSAKEDYLTTQSAKYLLIITFLIVLSFACNVVILAQYLGLQFSSKYSWSLTAMLFLTNIVNASEFRIHQRVEGLLQRGSVSVSEEGQVFKKQRN